MTTATKLIVELPLKLGAGLNNRGHWRVAARRAKHEREVAGMLVGNAAQAWIGGTSFPALIVTMMRLSAGTLDDDNLQGACKHVRDGIADAFGVPDNDPRIVWRYAQERCKRGQYGVRVEIEVVE